MRYFSTDCEAPGSFGPRAVLRYDPENGFLSDVEFLDLEFQVWLGSELVRQMGCFAVSERLWKYLAINKIKGVGVRDMAVTIGDDFEELCPDTQLPEFRELVLQKTARGEKVNGWILDSNSIPDADMFTGFGLPLFVNERTKELLVDYRLNGVEFEEAFLRPVQNRPVQKPRPGSNG